MVEWKKHLFSAAVLAAAEMASQEARRIKCGGLVTES
jgi:hypothetical protein